MKSVLSRYHLSSGSKCDLAASCSSLELSPYQKGGNICYE